MDALPHGPNGHRLRGPRALQRALQLKPPNEVAVFSPAKCVIHYFGNKVILHVLDTILSMVERGL